METSFVTLQGHQLHRLVAPVRLRTASGLLWVTVDGEQEDILLAEGESRCFPRPGVAVVAYALGGEARFEAAAKATATGTLPWRARLQSWWRGTLPALGSRA